MKKIMICLSLLLATLTLFSLPAYAVTIKKIIVFGDSLSDNGNLYAATANSSWINQKICDYLGFSCSTKIPNIPNSPPYYQGRFSNGPVWVEDLAEKMNLTQAVTQFSDYAVGGAWAEATTNGGNGLLPDDLDFQVSSYISLYPYDKSKAASYLFIIYIGGNDYLSGRKNIETATTNTVQVIQKEIDKLIEYGARNFLILNLPDLGQTPSATTQDANFADNLHQLSLKHNEKLAAMISTEKTAHSNVKFISVDVMQYFNNITKNPDKYQLKNVKDACFSGSYYPDTQANEAKHLNANLTDTNLIKINKRIMSNAVLREAYQAGKLASRGVQPCINPDDYLFWDHVHPTKVVHQMLANYVLETLRANQVY